MAPAQTMLLTGGANPKNIVWAVAGAVTLGLTSHFEGIVLGKIAATPQTGAVMNGRVLAQSLAVPPEGYCCPTFFLKAETMKKHKRIPTGKACTTV